MESREEVREVSVSSASGMRSSGVGSSDPTNCYFLELDKTVSAKFSALSFLTSSNHVSLTPLLPPKSNLSTPNLLTPLNVLLLSAPLFLIKHSIIEEIIWGGNMLGGRGE